MAARRQIVDDLRPSEPHTGSLDLGRLKGLLRRMDDLLAELESKACFALIPEPVDKLGQPKGIIRLDEEWKMGMLSTVALLAEHLHLKVENLGVSFWSPYGLTLEELEKNECVAKARQLSAVARRLLVALDTR